MVVTDSNANNHAMVTERRWSPFLIACKSLAAARTSPPLPDQRCTTYACPMTSDADLNQTGVNPYVPLQSNAALQTNLPRLNVPAWIAIVCCVTSLGFWLVSLVVSLPFGHPNAPPLVQIVGFTGVFMVLPAIGLYGSIAMLKRERYGMALAAASAMMVPVLGPCFGFTLPLGIWTIVLLRRDGVRHTFTTTPNPVPDDFDNADDALAAASKLDTIGDWHASIVAYRVAAEQWPGHAAYIDNCIADVQRKLDATEQNGG